LAVSKECKYCAASAEFYRRLAAGLGKQKTRLLAVFSDKESDGEAYLKRLEVTVREVRYVSFSSLGINSVPTLALVDRNGVVTYMWAGKLPPLEEKGLMSKLGLEDTRPPDEWSMTEASFDRKLANKEQLLLLDVRERESFATRHKDGARNIPLDELPVRAQNELSAGQTIVIYSNDASEMDLAYSILETQGFAHVLILIPNTTQY
jgi:rhodanese-related sulfurtransferase